MAGWTCPNREDIIWDGTIIATNKLKAPTIELDGTAGSVLFHDGTKITEDNANLFWNVGRTQLESNLIKITSDGTQAAPALKFNDTNTGFFKSGDSVRFSLNNSTKMIVDATGLEVLGTTGNILTLTGDMNSVGNNAILFNSTGGTDHIWSMRLSGTNADAFRIVDETDGRTPFFIDTVGMIGVGNNISPDEWIHILDTTANASLHIETEKVDGFASVSYENDAQEWRTQVNNEDRFVVLDFSNTLSPLQIESATPTNTLRLQATTGNVGMGTGSPNILATPNKVLTIKGADTTKHGAIELVVPDAVGTSLLGELNFINLDGGAGVVSRCLIAARRDDADNAALLPEKNPTPCPSPVLSEHKITALAEVVALAA